jgi:hypothetical protein
LLGAALRSGGGDDLVDVDVAAITRLATARLGAARFTAAYDAGAAMSRAEAEELIRRRWAS